ncbi:MAG: hypothetical protein AB7S49_10040 [Arcobacter sp.]|jgi:hypothetical protein|uniref:hypothetical protein n=1 Tax=Arcobacter sp. TaxID=1872629 RepID=UPI003D049EDF
MNKDKQILQEAYKLRFEYYNFYENKEPEWHNKYRNHKLYDIVVESFDYKYNEIGIIMPKLLGKLV